jgi:shikimate 5-dehydrogenase
MYPNSDRTVINSLPRNRVVMDIVYKPMKTKLLKIAESAGCEIITGEKMLIHQAIAQQKIWTGMEPEFIFMRKLFFDAEQ